MNPDYVNAYLSSGNKEMGCSSLRRACELGYCKDYKYAKKEGDYP